MDATRRMGPNLVIKAFGDLDAVFVRGVLQLKTQTECRSDVDILGRRRGYCVPVF